MDEPELKFSRAAVFQQPGNTQNVKNIYKKIVSCSISTPIFHVFRDLN